MPISLHSHSGQFCKHAAGTLEEVVQEAIHKGFIAYGLTEHVPRLRVKDLYPEELGLSVHELARQFSDFLAEAHRLKAKYSSQICLLVGAETEYITEDDLVSLSQLLDKHGRDIEYLVGSIHHANEIPIDFDHTTFNEALRSFAPEAQTNDVELLIVNYLDKQHDLMIRFQPAVIGHFDLFRLYMPRLRLDSYPAIMAKLERNIDYARGYGALFELNAAAFRKGWDTAYPGEDILHIIRSRGGHLTLSDDSHGPQYVGLNYNKLFDYAMRAGVSDVWYLAPQQGKPGLHPVKLEEDWKTHSFWGRNSSK